MDIKQEKEFAKLVKERSKAREKLENMREQVCDRRLTVCLPVTPVILTAPHACCKSTKQRSPPLCCLVLHYTALQGSLLSRVRLSAGMLRCMASAWRVMGVTGELQVQGNLLAAPPDLVDMDIQAQDQGFIWGGPQASDDDEEDFEPPEGESIDDDEDVKRHVRSTSACYG